MVNGDANGGNERDGDASESSICLMVSRKGWVLLVYTALLVYLFRLLLTSKLISPHLPAITVLLSVPNVSFCMYLFTCYGPVSPLISSHLTYLSELYLPHSHYSPLHLSFIVFLFFTLLYCFLSLLLPMFSG